MIDPLRRAKLQVESLLIKIGLMESQRACEGCQHARKKIAHMGKRSVVNWCNRYKQPAKAKCEDYQPKGKENGIQAPKSTRASNAMAKVGKK